MQLFTIGFTGKSAETFFTKLRDANVQKVIDIRLWPSTQLSGFSKSKDLAFFLSALCKIKYEHRVDLAPTADILKNYKEGKINWPGYEKQYINLLKQRKIAPTSDMNNVCFLCAETEPNQCHRRLLVAYLRSQDFSIEITHL